MNSVRKKVLLDLLGSPLTILPFTIGASCLLGSWATGIGGALAFAGVSGLLIGAGVLVSRFIFGVDKLHSDIYKYKNEEEFKQKEERLDQLDKKLCKDGDRRTQKALRELRELYDLFHKDVNKGIVSTNLNEILLKVQELFEGCISQLEYSLKLSGDQHEQVIKDVLSCVEQLDLLIKEFHDFRTSKMSGDLQQLRKELEHSMEVARKTEQHIADIDIDKVKSYTEEEFLE
ncbi:MAG: hypothetical protein NE330_11225 [Lentisphaeraceae bacterium]|nr:hypothetical protein [Lentisphaeraceae bacterium]